MHWTGFKPDLCCIRLHSTNYRNLARSFNNIHKQLQNGQLHKDDYSMMRAMVCIGWKVALQVNLPIPLSLVEHKRRPYSGGSDGLCYVKEGRVAVVIRYREQQDWWGKRIYETFLENPDDRYPLRILAHELAHLGEPSRAHKGASFIGWNTKICRTMSKLLDIEIIPY